MTEFAQLLGEDPEPLDQGPYEGGHFMEIEIDDQDFIASVICLNGPGARCWRDEEGCVVKSDWSNVGRDILEPKDGGQIGRIPIGYRWEGGGEDYEGFIYALPVRN